MAVAKKTLAKKPSPVRSGTGTTVTTITGSRFALLNSRISLVLLVLVFGSLGSFLLLSSHADALTTLYRLRENSSHFYTTSQTEVATYKKAGWVVESATTFTNGLDSQPVPVYRLSKGADHIYTTSADERRTAVRAGWKQDEVAFTSATSNPVPHGYCRQNWLELQNTSTTMHLYTPSQREATALTTKGYTILHIAAFSLDLPCTTNNSGAAALYVKLDTNPTVTNGGTVSLPIDILLNGIPTDALDLEVSYPQSLLSFQSLDLYASALPNALGQKVTNGHLSVTLASLGGSTTSTGAYHIATLVLKASTNAANAPISIDQSKAAYKGSAIDMITGGITVKVAN